MKTIKILSTRTSTPVVIESEASNWGELRDELSADQRFSDTNWSTTKVFMKDSANRLVLEFPETALSQENTFKLIISPAQMKAGSVRYTDAQVKELKTKMNNLLDDILGIINEEDKAASLNEFTDEDVEDIEDIKSMY